MAVKVNKTHMKIVRYLNLADKLDGWAREMFT